MTSPQSRRDVLKGTAALAVAATVGTATPTRRAHAQAGRGARIDSVLRQAVDAKDVPGVVAMAATDKGVLLRGRLRPARARPGPAMTLDTVFRIASMTKAITSVAAMQLVEQGKLTLEEPVPEHRPRARLAPGPRRVRRLRRAEAPPRQAADHAAPPADPHRRASATTSGTRTPGATSRPSGMPAPGHRQGRRRSARRWSFDPGDSWEYGINIDWAGRLVEAISGQPLDAYFREKHLRAARHEGQRLRHLGRAARAPGAAAPAPGRRLARAAAAGAGAGQAASSGRAAARSTRRARDYIAFLQMLLHGGSRNGARILKPETVALMGQNHTGDIPAGVMKTAMPALSNDVDFFPGRRHPLGPRLHAEHRSPGRTAAARAR